VSPGTLFRAEARARGPASERLDERVRLIPPRLWVGLTAATAIILGALAWAFLGQVDSKIDGTGILTGPPHTYELASPVAGRVTLLRDIGTQVPRGDPVAIIRPLDSAPVKLTSPVKGTVAVTRIAVGQTVESGTSVALVEPSGPAVAHLFVSADQGKVIKPGQPVQLSPTDTDEQSVGLLEGTVKQVLPYPVGASRIELLTGEPEFASRFLGGEAKVEVDVDLLRDPSTESGLKWTSGEGPPFQITAGTLTSGSVIIGQESPISLVFGD